MIMLDLYCCAGGASAGYVAAGWDLRGVDLAPQPNYPFPFLQADACGVLVTLLSGYPIEFDGAELYLADIDAFHASPPCQGYTALSAVHGNQWPRLIEPTRALLDLTGKPYVLENVQGAPLRRDVVLCGEMFGLGVLRHRIFELGGWAALQPPHVPHRGRVAGWRHGEKFDGPYVAVYGNGGGKGSVADWQRALGISWTSDRRELAESIPPAYAQWIGKHLLEVL